MGEHFNEFQSQAIEILLSGGWLMIPLVLIALMIYWTAFRLYFFFTSHKFYKTRKDKLLKYILNPVLAQGELRQILDYTQTDVHSVEEIRNRFVEVHHAYVSRIDRTRTFLLVLVTTAPLMGLLGTVTGMLQTFRGLAASTGTDTVDLIAGGISEALITTQTGLIIAIPGYVMAYMILKRRNEMDACLTSIETMTVQHFQKEAALTENEA